MAGHLLLFLLCFLPQDCAFLVGSRACQSICILSKLGFGRGPGRGSYQDHKAGRDHAVQTTPPHPHP